GLPIGAMIAAENCSQTLQPGFHGSTFGGNLVACAAANAVMQILTDPATTENVELAGNAFREKLAKFGTVEGRGLMIALELPDSVDAKQVVERLLTEQKVIANATGPSTLRFLPPLLIMPDQIDQAISALDAVLEPS
ncbi:MAG: aminotransferase class III-fold pyridoxal phosphate-dependent enzyme, partial [Solirubrobacterales bacterium]